MAYKIIQNHGITILLYMSSLNFNAIQEIGTKNKIVKPKIPVIK